MNALEKKLAEFLPQEMLALLEKIETIDGDENDYAIAEYINRSPLTKFERFMLVRAYRRYESRRARFQAMELLFPANKLSAVKQYSVSEGSISLTAQRVMPIPRSKVGHI